MKTDKELKKWFKTVASEAPEKYYATDVLEEEGFLRKKCTCGLWFWTTHKDQEVCGDPACQGGTSVVEENPSKVKLSFPEVWFQFKKMFEEWGYKAVTRYPVAARWNPTTDFTMASIAAFQPYVISGEVEPPAKKLVIPQFCLRFGDVDNVGITGSHCTGFVMIGQHQFVAPSEWNQNTVFRHIFDYITKGVGLPKEELTLHEDAWAGGSNYGPCMEFFSRGVELFNQVYMMFEHLDSGDKELDIKVLDMGLGMERVAWFSQGAPNIYEAIFPDVLAKLKERTKVKHDVELFKKFSPFSALLNIDEVEDINLAWKEVGDKMGMDGSELKQKILPMTALYSVAEHTRALLVALNDGALPSNVGGGYNLRVILRRALGFIDQFSWDLTLKEVAGWHADELKELFPELKKNLEQVERILDVETDKYKATKAKAAQIVAKVVDKEITEEMLLELYDSNGISPETIREEAKKVGKQVIVPDDFYRQVGEMHEQKEKKLQTKREGFVNADGVAETEVLYWGSHKEIEFEAKVLRVEGDNVMLDKTAFYPTSGGQMHDIGKLNGKEVEDVFKQGNVVVHKVIGHGLSEGDVTTGHVELLRREQLAIHHTATHIVNGAAKRVLGNHIWQAGAAKTLEKSRLDITHYDSLSKEEMEKIEMEANKMVAEGVVINKFVMARNEAEEKYGFALYQGGAVPGKKLRVVEIPDWDVEACGGTHLDNTSEVGKIKILKSSKLQDGIVRLEFAAGPAVERVEEKEEGNLAEVAKFLEVTEKQVPGRAEEVFAKWKKARKAVKKKKAIDISELDLISSDEFDGDCLVKTAEMLKTQPEHIINTLQRFLKELEEMKEKLKELSE